MLSTSDDKRDGVSSESQFIDEEKGCIRGEGGLGWREHGELGEVAKKRASDGAAFEIRKEVQPQNGVT